MSEESSDAALYRESVFTIPKMDCPSEENLIRMALGSQNGIRSLSFNLPQRELTLVHCGLPDVMLARLQPLKLGAALRRSQVLESEPSEGPLLQTRFSVPLMDCPSEENLIRMAIGDMEGLRSLSFDLRNRELAAVHTTSTDALISKMQALNLGAVLLESVALDSDPAHQHANQKEDAEEAKTLRLLLLINGVMFFVELALGLYAQSTGLIADSLDMFADAAVYGLALFAVGRAAKMKTQAAHLAGWLQLFLAVSAIAEVIRRFIVGSSPESALMMGIGLLALLANVTCLALISRKRDRGTHMTASYIFSANDVIANLGVIIAGILVAWSGSPYPDLVIGVVIGGIVLNGARRILKLQ